MLNMVIGRSFSRNEFVSRRRKKRGRGRTFPLILKGDDSKLTLDFHWTVTSRRCFFYKLIFQTKFIFIPRSKRYAFFFIPRFSLEKCTSLSPVSMKLAETFTRCKTRWSNYAFGLKIRKFFFQSVKKNFVNQIWLNLSVMRIHKNNLVLTFSIFDSVIKIL